MPSTFLSLHYHLVFSTRQRVPFIKDSWLPRLHEYLGGSISGSGGIAQQVGGVADHVHLLVGLKATHCLADFMRELKKASSQWVHEVIGSRLLMAGRLFGVHRQRDGTWIGEALHRQSGRASSCPAVSRRTD